MPPIGSALAGRIRRCGAWLAGPDFCPSRCVGGTGIRETAPPAALGASSGPTGILFLSCSGQLTEELPFYIM